MSPFLKVMKATGSCVGRKFLIKCSGASKVVAFPSRATFQNTGLFRSCVETLNYVYILEERECAAVSEGVCVSSSAWLTSCKRSDVS